MKLYTLAKIIESNEDDLSFNIKYLRPKKSNMKYDFNDNDLTGDIEKAKLWPTANSPQVTKTANGLSDEWIRIVVECNIEAVYTNIRYELDKN